MYTHFQHHRYVRRASSLWKVIAFQISGATSSPSLRPRAPSPRVHVHFRRARAYRALAAGSSLGVYFCTVLHRESYFRLGRLRKGHLPRWYSGVGDGEEMVAIRYRRRVDGVRHVASDAVPGARSWAWRGGEGCRSVFRFDETVGFPLLWSSVLCTIHRTVLWMRRLLDSGLSQMRARKLGTVEG
jgi:hypothetical protein